MIIERSTEVKSVSIEKTVGLDERISDKARGLLVRILCWPPGKRTDSETLALPNRPGRAREGRDSTRSALRELEDAGYITRVREHGDHGHWSTRMIVHETPVCSTSSQVAPETAYPAPVNPAISSFNRTPLPVSDLRAPSASRRFLAHASSRSQAQDQERQRGEERAGPRLQAVGLNRVGLTQARTDPRRVA